MPRYGTAATELNDRMRHRKPVTTEPQWRQREATIRRAGRSTLFEMRPAVGVAEGDELSPEGLAYWRDGGYPAFFMRHAYTTLGVTDPARVLHMCSGGVRVGITVDIRPETRPTIVADCRRIPLPGDSIEWIMADPPYGETYADTLYGTGDVYPRPRQILTEAMRLLRPGGRVGLLHYISPRAPKGLAFVNVWGVYVGPDMAIRAWSVYEKHHRGHGL